MHTAPRGVRLLVPLAAVGLLLSSCASPSGASDSFVVSSWGGEFTEATKTNFAKPFAEENDLKLQMVDASGQHLAQLQAQQDAGKVTWDVLDSIDEPTAALMFKRGLLEELPDELQGELKRLTTDDAVVDYGILQSTIATPFACNTEKAAKCPSNAAEFFDVENFPGDRTMYDDPWSMIATAFSAIGVDPQDEPSDAQVDQAFALIEDLRGSMRTLWGSADQAMQILSSGEAVMGALWNRSARDLDEQDPGVWRFAWDGALYDRSFTVIAKGAPSGAAAEDYLRWYAGHPDAQAAWSNETSYGVASPSALDALDDSARPWLPETHLDSLSWGNISWWLEHSDELTQRWQTAMYG